MDSKKTISIYAITNNKIDSLRAFINISKQMYHSQKNDLNNNDFLDWLKLSCFQIEEEIENTIDYYQLKENEASLKTIEKAKDKCKDLSILLNKYKLELLSFGFGANEYSIYKKELKDAFDFDLTIETKELVENYLEIKKEFEDFIKIETTYSKVKSKKLIDKNDLNFQVLLAFANGRIYELHKNGLSHPKKATEIFKNNDKKNTIVGYIKNSYTNISKDKDHYNKNKNLFNNIDLIEAVKKYCAEENIFINDEFLTNCNKNNLKRHD